MSKKDEYLLDSYLYEVRVGFGQFFFLIMSLLASDHLLSLQCFFSLKS
jgi:hypothetical protein